MERSSLIIMAYMVLGGSCSPITIDSLSKSSTPSCGGTMCGRATSEPISKEVKLVRNSAACTLDNADVLRIKPREPGNPANVRNVESIFPESIFEELFPNRDAAYTYTNFLRAIGKYPAICASAKLCPKILANMFAHFQQETAGLVYQEEINKSLYCADWAEWIKTSYPCRPDKMYYGRGAKQLSWNYNYGAFSSAIFGDPMILLENPELVANTWLNFASAMWFFVSPQPPKPSMLQVIDGTWKPNTADSAANIQPGLGATTLIINGALECGSSPPNPTGADNRARYYKDYAGKLGVDITGEHLLCSSLSTFSSDGSAGKAALYWGSSSGCSLVTWQTAYSSLVEGDYSRCRGEQPTCLQEPQQTSSTSRPESSTTSYLTSTLSTTAISHTTLDLTSPSTSKFTISSTSSSIPTVVTAGDSSLCLDPSGLYPHPSSCQTYYQCSLGVPHAYSCPAQLVWNDVLKLCDWSDRVDCTRTGQTTEPSKPTPTTLSHALSTTQPITQPTTQSTRTPPIRESTLCSDPALFYPHETDCSLFYQCVGSVPQVLACVQGTAWNSQAQKCDWVDRVQCQNGLGLGGTTRIQKGLPSATTAPSTTTSVESPGTFCSEDRLYPHKEDPQKYYQCYGGVPYSYSCVSGTFWNTALSNCDWIKTTGTPEVTTASLVQRGSTTPPTRSPATSTPPKSTPTTSAPTQLCLGQASFLDDPTDCQKYFVCVGGVGYPYSCSGGTAWNKEISACDWVENVECGPATP